VSVEYVLTEPTRPEGGPTIEYAKELNAEQLEAVTAPPGPMLVIAGAGSGKTRTLTYRVAWLVENGVPPEQIMLLTFTNKASKQMLERVAFLLPHDLSRLWGGTFHHIGNRILRRHADQVGYTKDYVILDREDAEDLIAASMVEAGVDPKNKAFPKAQVLADIFSLAANHRTTCGSILKGQFGYFTEFEETIGKIGEIYLRRKRESMAMDYDDLLTLSLRLLEEPGELRERYRARFQHILVDEYQDTNRLQSDFIDALGSGHHQVMAVGDDAQSIYSWRGAKVEHILSFPERYPGAKMVRLETNYRSIPQILDLANHSISHNPKQFPKNLKAVRDAGVKPAVVTLEDGGQQATFVAQRILEMHEEGTSLSDIAILYRAHFHAMEIQLEFTRRNIPYTITSGLRFFEQAHVKDVAAHLRLSVNAKDEVAFYRLARLLPGVGPKSATKMWQEVVGGRGLGQLKVPEKGAKGWMQMVNTLGQLTGKDPSEQVKIVVEGSYGDYIKSRYTNAANRMDDLRQLEDYATTFKETAEFLAQMALLGNTDTELSAKKQDGSEDAVHLSTIHQAKGLEYGTVFVVMLCEGMFPSSRSLETEDAEEEERRLFYVAVTRAKDELYLTHPRLRMGKGGDAWQTPSRFLNELSKELVNVWKVKGSSGLGDWT
jgi:DNA helicase II / ATP-dependent DNA helicase PcrA